jgi:hypothetical protein
VFQLPINYYMAEDATSGSGEATAELGKEDIIELLGEEEPEEAPLDLTPKKKSEDDDSEAAPADEEDELAEIEEELKGPKEEDLELTTPVRRKEILAKYPQLFKDFPYLEKAYYREQQFTELLPTIQDARLAVQKADVLDRTERQVMNGDITSILSAAKQENTESFNRIADNYLPALRAVDQQAYYHVLGNVIKDTIVTMVRESRSLGEQGAPLQAAANILNQFVFGSQNFSPAQPLSRQVRPEENQQAEQWRQQQTQQVMSRFESTRDDLQTRADNVLKSTIDQHLDPNDSMSEYVKRTATREAFETLEDLMGKDTRFRGLLDKLWERAFERSFDKDSTDRIKAAYLSKAKTLLPTVIKKARNDALKGSGKRASSDSSDDNEEMASKKGPITPGRSTSPSSGKYKKGSEIPKGMSTLDVLMQD